MAERIPRVGDRLDDVPPGWVVQVNCETVMVGRCFPGLRYVTAIADGSRHAHADGAPVTRIIGRFVDGEWQPYEPPKVLVNDLPLGTQVRFGRTGSAVWVILETGFDSRNARGLHFGRSTAAPHEPVAAYRNDDTDWEWVDA